MNDEPASLTQPTPPAAPQEPVAAWLGRPQVGVLLDARARGSHEASVSLDLGLTRSVVDLQPAGIRLPSGLEVRWEVIEHVASHENMCFELRGEELVPIRAYSEQTRRAYQLMPTALAPALLLSGFLMHRIRGTSPIESAHAMVHQVLPVRGRLLDTATGLGYAAVEAAKHADGVVSVELDPAAQSMARRNPWSRDLFDNPKITLRIGDSSTLIKNLENREFAAIVHDPPSMSVAGELYSEQFYREAHRVLGHGGRMFHYVGDPDSVSGGRTTKGVVRRLLAAGFRRVDARPQAFGVVAHK